jgi:hypothetical protein
VELAGVVVEELILDDWPNVSISTCSSIVRRRWAFDHRALAPSTSAVAVAAALSGPARAGRSAENQLVAPARRRL